VLRQLSARARTALPPEALARVRQGVLLWGQATAGARLMPSFVIIGAQRCGTTSLFRVLSDHPDVVRPTMSKGIGYFDVNYPRGERWYRAHFPVAAVARARTGGRAQTFESSGYYAVHPLSAGRIARDLPDAKVVLMVRNPVNRAYSAHRHESSRGFEDVGFEQALELEPTRIAGEVERMVADPGYESYEHRHHAYLTRSRYADQVQRYVDALGPDRVRVVDADRFFADPQSELDPLFAWLGLRPWRVGHVDAWNARPGSPLASKLEQRLLDHFAEPDRRLAELTGRTPSWRDPDFPGAA